MNSSELKERTKQFALRIIKLVEALPKSMTGRTIGNQLVRSGTSTAANYRAVCRSRSRADFISKLGIVIEECDESAFWLEIIVDSKLMKKDLIDPLLKEVNELVAIFVSSRKTSIENNKFKNLKS
ncbi:MAG: four helix bundle protein [Candidatus Moraniibacteriota bacterium]